MKWPFAGHKKIWIFSSHSHAIQTGLKSKESLRKAEFINMKISLI
jgi:hypothetical protein